MSDLLGKMEVENGEGEQGTLYIGSFSGGDRRGPCIQLTLPSNWDLAQLPESDVRKLSKILDRWLFDHTLRRSRQSGMRRLG